MGRKWTPSEAIQSAKSALDFRDMVGQVQYGEAVLGLVPKVSQWHKVTSVQKRRLMAKEVRRREEAERHIKTISMAKKDQWTN